jgi:2-polyprenyl-3-methyl-5-hydroxy-6-metoxy-1,4-benzoquinol methylase
MDAKRLKHSAYEAICTLRLEHQLLTILKIWNKITLQYDYPYLKEVSARGETLLNIMQPYLKPQDNFLDVMCGYSPLAGPLLKRGYTITGFDNYGKAIKYLNQNYPEGKWIRSSFQELKLKSSSDRSFSVILLLGVGYACCQPSFTQLINELISVNKPRLFFLETSKNTAEVSATIANPFVGEAVTVHWSQLKAYNAMLRLLIGHNYEIVDVGQYDAEFKEEWASARALNIRIYTILKLKEK